MKTIETCEHKEKNEKSAVEICKDCGEIVSKYVTVVRGKVRRSLEYKAEDDKNYGYIAAIKKVLPLPGYYNQYSTDYIINQAKQNAKKYTNVEIVCENHGWATRGHGMTDVWTEAEGYINKEKYYELKEKILQVEEDDYDTILEIYNEIKETVSEACDYEEDDDYED